MDNKNDDNKRNNVRNIKPKKRSVWVDVAVGVIFLIVLIGIVILVVNSNKEKVIDYTQSEYISVLEEDLVKTANIQGAKGSGNHNIIINIFGELKDGTKYKVTVKESDYNAIGGISNKLTEKNVLVEVKEAPSENVFVQLLITLLPFLLILVGVIILFKFLSGGNGKAFEFGKTRARLSKDKDVHFEDVAGQDEEKEEMAEVIDFLKNPRKYQEMGARIPKGILLVGPPGTGKTLLARAVAGEANVPFFIISGSDFVEMFVGVGASRVRDMFKVAKQQAPCIVFIDEIDAVGRQRGAGLGGGHDEREQTLNQLLTEMDGFGANSGVIVMAATNRPDVLDPALLRPGRFDRRITVNTPDVKGREAILKVHARNKKLDPSVELRHIAKRTPGYSGADLENVLNESALLAARSNRKAITMKDVDEAVDRVAMGPAKKSRIITKRERETVAHHEAGHAVIGLKVEDASIVHKVTIIPRGNAGGYAMIMPEEDRYNHTRTQLINRIVSFLGGRVAEEIIFDEVTTGAHNDFERATKIARAMVTEYGMSRLGPVQFEHQDAGSVFLGRDYTKHKNFSEKVANEIDVEVRAIIDECYSKAKKVLTENVDLLKTIAKYLLEIETLTKEDIDEINETGKIKWWEDEKLELQKKENNQVDENVVQEKQPIQTEVLPTDIDKTENNNSNDDVISIDSLLEKINNELEEKDKKTEK